MGGKENSRVYVSGKITKPFCFSHKKWHEGFYSTEISIERLSGAEDRIPVIVSERVIDVREDFTGEFVEINGSFRSYNKYDGEKSKLMLFVFADEINFLDENENSNEIVINGFVCKPPVYRKTPFGREITDILVAVNKNYKRSYYIPCICWGRNALYASRFEVGEHIHLWGRIQSREYIKHTGENQIEKHVAYEVSAETIVKTEEMENEVS